MPGVQDIPGKHIARATALGQATAGTADDWAVFVAPANIKVTAVRWVPHAAVTGVATNNFALQVINKGAAGSGTATVTQVKTYALATNSAAYVAEALTLSATAADLLAAAGDVIALVRTVNGTGLAMPDGTVEVEYQYR